MEISGDLGSNENDLPWASGVFWLEGYSGSNDYHNRGNTGNMRAIVHFAASRNWTGSTSDVSTQHKVYQNNYNGLRPTSIGLKAKTRFK